MRDAWAMLVYSIIIAKHRNTFEPRVNIGATPVVAITTRSGKYHNIILLMYCVKLSRSNVSHFNIKLNLL